MHEWKGGALHSGSKSGPKVTSQKQAEAIAFSEDAKMKGGGSKKAHSSKKASKK